LCRDVCSQRRRRVVTFVLNDVVVPQRLLSTTSSCRDVCSQRRRRVATFVLNDVVVS